jgi:selenocysteine lyase/cysteine desulfurase
MAKWIKVSEEKDFSGQVKLFVHEGRRIALFKLVHYYENQNANVHRALHKLGGEATAAYEDSRKKVAHFINARSEREIVFTRGTTDAINLVASAWGRKNIQPGDEILLSEMEHHSNMIPWQLLAKKKAPSCDSFRYWKEVCWISVTFDH